MWLTKQMHHGTIIKPLKTAASEEAFIQAGSGFRQSEIWIAVANNCL